MVLPTQMPTSVFSGHIADQAATDKIKAELLMMVTTLAIGGGMSALFGSAVLRTVAVDRAVDFVCRRNMERALNAMAWIEGNPAASFIAQGIWDGTASILTARTKQRVEGLVSQSPLGADTVRNPLSFQNDLQRYLLTTVSAAHDVAAEVRDNRVLSEEGRNDIAEGLRNAPFFDNAPTRSVISDPARVRKELELLLYMGLVMNSDYIQETSYWMRGAHEGRSTRRIGAVTEAASGENYPRASSAHSHGPGHIRDTFRTVEYDRPGGRYFSDIMDRVNELHRELFGGNFEQGSYGRDEIARAEQLSQRIQRQYFLPSK